MAQIYLVRHTTPDIKPGICYGVSDLALANTFEAESRVISEKLAGTRFDAVYTSPLKRCTQLAEKLSPNLFTTDSRLMELNFGQWELQPWNAIYKTPYGKEWMDNYLELPCPEGESYKDLYARVKSYLTHCLAPPTQPLAENILIITHAGVIRVFLSVLKGMAIEETFKMKMGFGEVVVVKNLSKPNVIS